MKFTRFTAMFTACAAAVAACSAMPVCAADSAVLPAWVPASYEQALDFRNTHGFTHTADGTVCAVFSETFSDDAGGETANPNQITAEGDSFVQVSRECYTSDMSEPGIVRQYEVCVWQAESAGELAVSFANAAGEISGYTFACDESGALTETDIFGWLPDCNTEFDAFVREHGAVSTHGQYVLFAITEGIGTAYHWEETNNTGAPAILTSYCSMKTDMLVAGGSNQFIEVYDCASTAGYVGLTIRWDMVDYSGTGDPIETMLGEFAVLDGGETVLQRGDARIRLRDYDTDELIDFADYPEGSFRLWVKYNTNSKQTDSSADWGSADWTLLSNPAFNRLGDFMENADDPSFGLDTEALPSNLLLTWDGTEIEYYENHAMDVTLRLKDQNKIPTFLGDVNSDGQFDLSDVVALVKWLVGDPDAALANWINGDFDHNLRIDARDLTRMKRALTQSETPPPPTGEKTAKMLLTSSSGGYGVAGQYLGGSVWSTEYTVREGDVFCERMGGVWYLPVGEPEDETKYARTVEITAITAEGVTYLDYTRGEFPVEHTLRYGEQSETIWSTPNFTVSDGRNFDYLVTFAAE